MLPILLALAISWGSYSDAQHKVPSDYFEAYHAQIYMYGTGFQKNTYFKVHWYDGEGVIVLTEVTQSKGNGQLSSFHVVGDTDVHGTWYARVYTMQDVFVVEDSFWVAPSAVPEFTGPIAAWAVVIICGIIYWQMRRKR